MQTNIVTGQQIGLLGGPLFTTYKVLGCLKLAKKLKGTAIYWMESNDADFNEINTIYYLNKKNTLKKLKWEKKTHGLSIGKIIVDEALINLLNIFFDDIHQTENTSFLKSLCFDCYIKGNTLMEASLKLAKSLFKNDSLVFFDPSEKSFLNFSKPFLIKEAHKTLEGNQCHLFAAINNQRKTLFKKKGHFVDRNNQIIPIENHFLLPHLKTRSILQDAYFKTHTYIAGPSEEIYLKNLKEQYHFHQVKPPKIQKRMSATFIEPSIKKTLKKLDLSLDFFLNKEQNNLIKDYFISKGDLNLPQLKEKFQKINHHYFTQLESLNIEKKEIEKWLFQKSKEIIGAKRKKLKEKREKEIKNLQFISTSLTPYGKPQERIFNLFYYLNLYGLNLIKNIENIYDFKRETIDILEIIKK